MVIKYTQDLMAKPKDWVLKYEDTTGKSGALSGDTYWEVVDSQVHDSSSVNSGYAADQTPDPDATVNVYCSLGFNASRDLGLPDDTDFITIRTTADAIQPGQNFYFFVQISANDNGTSIDSINGNVIVEGTSAVTVARIEGTSQQATMDFVVFGYYIGGGQWEILGPTQGILTVTGNPGLKVSARCAGHEGSISTESGTASVYISQIYLG